MPSAPILIPSELTFTVPLMDPLISESGVPDAMALVGMSTSAVMDAEVFVKL